MRTRKRTSAAAAAGLAALIAGAGCNDAEIASAIDEAER